MSKCVICGRPRAYSRGDDEWPYLTLVIGLGMLLLGGVCAGSVWAISVGAVIVIFSIWSLFHISTTTYCSARPEWGETCHKIGKADMTDPKRIEYQRNVRRRFAQLCAESDARWNKNHPDQPIKEGE